MSPHERILAALHRQPVDRIPFVPLIDTYSLLDMPHTVQQAMQAGANEGYWQGMLAAAREIGCDIMLRQALLTTMPNMFLTIQGLEKAGLRQLVRVMIGGAPITEDYAPKIGADGFAADASLAVKLALSLKGQA